MLTKRQRLRKHTETVLHALGAYTGYRKFDANSVNRLVFICSGNICRSAYGEVYAKSIGIDAASFGVHCPDNDPANDKMMRTAAKRGLSLESHKTTSITNHQAKQGDLIVAMDKHHIDIIQQHANHKNTPAVLLGLFSDNSRATIIDPYGKPDAFFEYTVDELENSINTLKSAIDSQ